MTGINAGHGDENETMTMRLMVVPIPVMDVDRAKAFYVGRIGFHEDHDQQVNEHLRFVQLTSPGSACSIVMGTGIVEMAPGTQKGLIVVVDDVEAWRWRLLDHGVGTSEVDVQSSGSFIYFADPDGNTWTVQQLPRLQTRPDGPLATMACRGQSQSRRRRMRRRRSWWRLP